MHSLWHTQIATKPCKDEGFISEHLWGGLTSVMIHLGAHICQKMTIYVGDSTKMLVFRSDLNISSNQKSFSFFFFFVL